MALWNTAGRVQPREAQDLHREGQRSTLFTLTAEIQHRLLPASFPCEAGAFTLSAWLEQAALANTALANTALVEHGSDVSGDDFATGLLGRLELGTGTLALVNAGHVAPYLAGRD